RLAAPADGSPYIRLQIEEVSQTERVLKFALHDMAVPTAVQIRDWLDHAMLPAHIRKHAAGVARVAGACADDLLGRGVFVRKKALVAAAKLHDVLRFTDFKSLTGDAYYTPTPAQTAAWTALKQTYGQPHELAAQRFMDAEGFPGIGTIIRSHGSHGVRNPEFAAVTIEQKILAYSDKRMKYDTLVSVDQRFDDFLTRYADGKETEMSMKWRTQLKALEKELFPDGPPL
ncbi:MAG TPA: hypothetical protein PKV72_06560, partial [Candidatus Peribacteria bacterium]|nr:hypothetical protein [Candidatus Peribacteria bacterium]